MLYPLLAGSFIALGCHMAIDLFAQPFGIWGRPWLHVVSIMLSMVAVLWLRSRYMAEIRKRMTARPEADSTDRQDR